MPAPSGPAKKTAEGGKKKAAVDDAPKLDEATKALQQQVSTLTEQLSIAQLRLAESEATVAALRMQIAALAQSVTHSQSQSQSLSMDAARQYKSMREDLLTQLDTVKESLSQSHAAHGQQCRQYEAKLEGQQRVIDSKDRQIVEMQSKYDDLTVEFGTMLQSTLDKMTERMELTSQWSSGESVVGEKDAGAIRTIEEFAIARI